MASQLEDIDNNTSSIDRHVSKRIKLRRTMLGFSQAQLGEFLGLTFQQVQKYENATNRISAGRLGLLAAFLKVPVSWFYEGVEEVPHFLGIAEGKQAPLEGAPAGAVSAGDALDADILDRRETMDLVRAYYAVKDQQQRRKILDLIKTMADG